MSVFRHVTLFVCLQCYIQTCINWFGHLGVAQQAVNTILTYHLIKLMVNMLAVTVAYLHVLCAYIHVLALSLCQTMCLQYGVLKPSNHTDHL